MVRKPSTGSSRLRTRAHANKKLAKAFGDLADALENVKEARRVSIVQARQAMGELGKTDAIKEGRAAILELNNLGYAAEAAAP